MKEDHFYTIIMIDPDMPTRTTPINEKTQVLHWLMVNIPGNGVGGRQLAPYIDLDRRQALESTATTSSFSMRESSPRITRASSQWTSLTSDEESTGASPKKGKRGLSADSWRGQRWGCQLPATSTSRNGISRSTACGALSTNITSERKKKRYERRYVIDENLSLL